MIHSIFHLTPMTNRNATICCNRFCVAQSPQSQSIHNIKATNSPPPSCMKRVSSKSQSIFVRQKMSALSMFIWRITVSTYCILMSFTAWDSISGDSTLVERRSFSWTASVSCWAALVDCCQLLSTPGSTMHTCTETRTMRYGGTCSRRWRKNIGQYRGRRDKDHRIV